jgi:hypothetical protein
MRWLATYWRNKSWIVYFKRVLDGRLFYRNDINPNVFLPCTRQDMRRIRKSASVVYQ